jgi:hypothetical protein
MGTSGLLRGLPLVVLMCVAIGVAVAGCAGNRPAGGQNQHALAIGLLSLLARTRRIAQGGLMGLRDRDGPGS